MFDLERKLKSCLKFEPNMLNFLTWLPNGKIENTIVWQLFFFFIQFSAIEMRSVVSHAKLMMSSLEWLEKKVGAHARWWAMAIFQLIELNVKGNPPCFQYAHARGRTKWRHKLCAERMCSANVRNDLNCYNDDMILFLVLFASKWCHRGTVGSFSFLWIIFGGPANQMSSGTISSRTL